MDPMDFDVKCYIYIVTLYIIFPWFVSFFPESINEQNFSFTVFATNFIWS